ncbi:hypothetical protein ACFW1M_40135 [Streptomyces inhibens]|uniref:hypothetical protein n=1 Tax=Streptomyces inhibens TaxID=2293571 RepID=UPI0036B645EC
MQVVDDDQQRLPGGNRLKEPQHGVGNEKLFRRRAAVETERHAQGVAQSGVQGLSDASGADRP